MGQVIREYTSKRGENINEITIGSTFAIKNFAKNPEDIAYGNHWFPYDYPIPTTSSFETNLKGTKANSKKLKGNWRVLGMGTLFKMTLKLPYNIP